MTPLAVVAVGARTPLGLDAVQTGFLLRAGFPAIGQSPLADAAGEPIAMAFLPTLDARSIGPERLVALARPALVEARRPLGSMAVEACLSIDEGVLDEAAVRAALEAMVAREIPGARVQIEARGEAGVVAFLAEAVRSLELRKADAVILGGVHSDHDPRVIAALAAGGRLFQTGHLDARIPGEAAAFFVIMRAVEAAGRGLAPLAEITGWGLGREEARPDNEAPAAVAQGLSAAVQQATASLREEGAAAGWMWTDLGHEARRLREWQSVFIRSQKVLARPYYLDSPAQRLGSLGAAALPLFVATAGVSWSHGYAPSPIALGTAGTDGGERAALLLRRPTSNKDLDR